MMALGAVGLISVVANAFPAEVAQLAKLCLENNYAEARKIHSNLIRLTELCFAEGNPAGVKEMLHQLGICGATVRLPLMEASAQLTEAIRGELPLYSRSEEHTSELQSLMRISYAVFCLKKQK